MSYPLPVLKGPGDGSQNLLRAATLREGCTAGPGATGMKCSGKGRTFLWKANRRVTPTPPTRDRKTWTDPAIILKGKK